MGRPRLSVGMARMVLGDDEAADADFASAMALAESAWAPYWTALTAFEWAGLLAKRDGLAEAERARDLLRAALDTARKHGFTRAASRAEARLEQIQRVLDRSLRHERPRQASGLARFKDGRHGHRPPRLTSEALEHGGYPGSVGGPNPKRCWAACWQTPWTVPMAAQG